ncbi:hypothetical protein N656DRAFT_779054 [Canariomyces notabilis]|uniref:Uncharacterized protein n=1 Tax=Canariomyces notabilis TaxID=2074819 RepID=A0AAN6YT53_9PEZI|nr:hypothetical protein N656DRAFT_779054 [Canariomyces arenarius]
MCTTYADYWRCGHIRRHRLVICSRTHAHYLRRELGKTYAIDCSACHWRDLNMSEVDYLAERDSDYSYCGRVRYRVL